MFASLSDGSIMSDAGSQYGEIQFAELPINSETTFTDEEILAAIAAGEANAANLGEGTIITDDLYGLGIGEASDLELGVNERYREAIMLAAERTGLPPETIAAVINAEAATYGGARLTSTTDEEFYTAHPELNGRALTGGAADAALRAEWSEINSNLDSTWDPLSSAGTSSSARGLTQFLKGTWETEATNSGTYLNETARDRGYVDDNNKVIAGQKQNLLNLRNDPTISIVAAAEYDSSVFNTLESRNLIPEGLTPDQEAPYIYIGHHEGATGAQRLLSGTLSEDRAFTLFTANQPLSSVANYTDEHGTVAAGYQAWLEEYAERRIRPDLFRD